MKRRFEIRSVWSTKQNRQAFKPGIFVYALRQDLSLTLPSPQTPLLGRGAPPQKRRCGPAGPVASLRNIPVHENCPNGVRALENRPPVHKSGPYGARETSRFEIMRQKNYLYIDKSEFFELNSGKRISQIPVYRSIISMKDCISSRPSMKRRFEIRSVWSTTADF